MAAHTERSRCPIAYSLDVLGDRWTLLILRDLAFKGRRYFADFLRASEGISTKTLANRLHRLEGWDLIVKAPDPTDQRRNRYYLTDEGLDVLPLLIEMTIWGARRHPDPDPPAEQVARIREDRSATLRWYRERHVAERER